MRATYETDGTENLRADPSVKHVDGDRSPGGGGTDAGGTDNKGTSTEVKHAAGNTSPSGSPDNHPAGVQTFTDSSV